MNECMHLQAASCDLSRRLGLAGTGSPLSLPLVLGVVVGEAVENEHLAPLGALVERRQELVDGLGVHLHQRVTAAARLVDLSQRGHRVSHHLQIRRAGGGASSGGMARLVRSAAP